VLGRSAAPTTAAATSGGGHGHSSGPFAEPTASVREHCDGNTVVFHVVTCVPEGSGQFASHGHTLRLTLRPAATQAGHHEKPSPWQRAGRILRAYHVALIEGGGVFVAVVTHGGSAAEEPFGETGAGLRRGWGVSPGRQQAIACTLQGLVPGGGRLSPARLQAVTGALVARRNLWADLVVHDPDVRWYLPLHRSNSCDVWLLAWECGQDTDWHDHGGSSGSFAAAEGCLVEQYRAASGRRLSRRQVVAGRGVAFGRGMYTTWRTAAAGRRPVSTPTHRRCWR